MSMDILALCLALTVYFEARGEPLPGQHAVAEVVVNRARRSGRSVCVESFHPGQFSWNQTIRHPVIREVRAWNKAQQVAQAALHGRSNYARGATHFHAAGMSPPAWASALCRVAKIGRHIFYGDCNT